MRFKQFKVLKEAATPVFYTIGDSHAGGVGTAMGYGDPGKSTYNLAVNGAAAHGRGSRSQDMLNNIKKLPKGANVLIGVGANDTADAVRANVDSGGKTALPPVSKIVNEVMKVVNLVKAQQPAQTVFFLFPSGDNKKTKYYAGDYQKEVREALQSAVGMKVIDLDGGAMQPDGIHYAFSVYKQVGEQAKAQFGNKPNAAPQSQPSSDAKSKFLVTMPQGNKNPQVADVQKALIALGFPLPKHGVDGIRGPETSSALRDFQQANGISASGMPDQATVDLLNKQLQDKPEVLAKLTPSTDRDVKPGSGTTTSSASLKQDSVTKGKIGQVLDFIARYESAGNYEIVFPSKNIRGLTNATINTIYELQDAMVAKNGKSSAVGRYQYIKDSLQMVSRQMGLDPNTTVFDEKTQDEICIFDLKKRCGLDQWMAGNMSDEVFLDKLSNVWAAIPDPQTGQTKYKDGVNKAGVNTQTALNSLANIKAAKT